MGKIIDIEGLTEFWAKAKAYITAQLSGKQDALSEAQMSAVNSGATAAKVADYDSHISNTSNPHSVTKAQIGLGSVDNTADASKSVAYAASAGNADTVDNLHVSDMAKGRIKINTWIGSTITWIRVASVTEDYSTGWLSRRAIITVTGRATSGTITVIVTRDGSYKADTFSIFVSPSIPESYVRGVRTLDEDSLQATFDVYVYGYILNTTTFHVLQYNENFTFPFKSVSQDNVPANNANIYRAANTTDSVASAEKLTNSRTLWGQSFDGTADVSGDLTGVGNVKMNGALQIGGAILTYDSTAKTLTLTDESGEAISFVASGNVTALSSEE